MAQLLRIGELGFIEEILNMTIICMVKISVSLFLLRIGGLKPWLRFAFTGTICLLAVSNLLFVLVICLYCRPISGFWDPMVQQTAKCLPEAVPLAIGYAATGQSTVHYCPDAKGWQASPS